MTVFDDADLLAALRAGDEAAFRQIVQEFHASFCRVARMHVPEAVVDEVVQETWLGVVRGLPTFEGRSSLKTWMYRILLNQARRRGPREKRTIPMSSAAHTVDPDRLVHPELGRGYWPDAPPAWHDEPEQRLLSAEVRAHVESAIAALPDLQRTVITLRDVEGWSASEVCDLLHCTAVHQRVLLHRARTSVRDALEGYFDV